MAKKKTTSRKTSRKKTTARKKKTSSRRSSVATEDYSSRILNCVPSQDTHEDWNYDTALAAGLAGAVAIPASKDLRENWWEIGDQGSTGSCVGWAAADSVLRWHLVNAGRLTTTENLSPRFTWMASKETDIFNSRPTTFIENAGTSLKAALDISRKFGAVRDTLLPFGTAKLYPGDARTFYAIASQFKIANYINLGRNIQDWREWLADNGPILTRLNVDQSWQSATSNDGELDVYDPYPPNDGRGGGHAIALVGYKPNKFIVRNSWGTGWGDQGFAYASDDYASDAFTEAYGVVIQ
ncbi:C1 family peptidase [uncultured Gimesia sp.]|uniref:C1 family peptidase n=1 Tax=uncultured Gimesia sp. TaxID=1678688 RepID=UPI00261363B6|nr:C1 family peptidase [uncultured Gimesia sp.]